MSNTADQHSHTDNTVVDAVFVIGTGSTNANEELRYALRNLEKNCRFVRDVYIVGECPSWVNTDIVKHIKWPDRFRHAKDSNIIDKLRHACEYPGIAENILFCSDDQFQTRECTWDDFSPRWLRRYTSDDPWYESRNRVWHTRLRKTLERDKIRREQSGLNTSNVFYYQPHIWMQINRDKFIEYAKWSEYETRDDTIIASGYFNYVDAGGRQNYDHVFISQNQKWPVNMTHVAYSDNTFADAMKYLHSSLKSISKYEIDVTSVIKTTDSNKSADRNDDDIIADIKKLVYTNKVWAPLINDITDAEYLRRFEFRGWKKVWNDIIHRWKTTTNKGALLLPVTVPRDAEADDLVKKFYIEHPDLLREDSNTLETGGIAGKAIVDNNAAATVEKKCSKCEERRRKAAEEARIRNEKAVKETTEIVSKAKETTMHQYDQEDDKYACIDCAIEHIASAVAYLGSNMSRPSVMDIELARGELNVAAQHLVETGNTDEYDMCVSMLDSMHSENSRFSAHELKSIMKRIVEKR